MKAFKVQIAWGINTIDINYQVRVYTFRLKFKQISEQWVERIHTALPNVAIFPTKTGQCITYSTVSTFEAKLLAVLLYDLSKQTAQEHLDTRYAAKWDKMF